MAWYVITGGPSCGKSTTVKELSKLGYLTVPEVARLYFEQELAKGRTLEEVRADKAKVQAEILRMQLEQEKKIPRNRVVFFDRAIPDTLAYFEYYKISVPEWAAKEAFKPYKRVFFLEQLPIEKDHVRTENEEEAEQINQHIVNTYKRLNYELVAVPVMSVKERVRFILSKIRRSK
jgi:predicted ATPase